MKKLKTSLILIFCFALVSCILPQNKEHSIDSKFVGVSFDPKVDDVKMQWRNEESEPFRNFENLKSNLEEKGKELVFAMNGGIYMEDRTPLGLYIEDGALKTKINKTQTAYGNFYLQPNGIFFLNKDGTAQVQKTVDFKTNPAVMFATQSGPMLVIDGKIHSKFNKGSENTNIRNGVGILPNGEVLFAISKEKVNLYDFGKFFQDLGCKNALYLDGFVSRMYAPSVEQYDLGGNFGAMIYVSK